MCPKQRLVVLALLWCVYTVEAYRRGDIVRSKKRSWFNEEISPRTPLISNYAPKFEFSKRSSLMIPFHQAFVGDYKIELSFDDDTFLTPWITAWDADRVLSDIEVSFLYSGDDIIDMKYDLAYQPRRSHSAEKDKDTLQPQWEEQIHITLRYTWVPRPEADPRTGAGFILISACFASTLGCIYIIGTEQYKLIRRQMNKRQRE